MQVLDEPRDFVGYLLAHVVEQRLEDPNINSKVKTWKMTVNVETNYYPLSMIFDNGLRITRDIVDSPTLSVSISMDTISRIIKEEYSPIKAFLNGDIKVKGMFSHPLAMKRFYSLLIGALKG
jgi:putative sterol carrier protein